MKTIANRNKNLMRMETKKLLFSKTFYLLALVLVSFGVQASPAPVVILSNTIDGTNPSSTNPFTSGQVVATGLTSTGIGRGPGLSAVNASNVFSANNWITTSSLNLGANDYFEFTLTVTPGYVLNLDGFTYTGQRNNNGPRAFSFRSSLDSYGSAIGTDFTTTSTAAQNRTVGLTAAAYQGLTGTVTFRLYGYNAGNNGGQFSINDFSFQGELILQAPVLSNVAPLSVCSNATSVLTLTGTNLLQVSSVTVGAASASILTQTATSLTVQITPGVGGLVTVTNAAGSSSQGVVVVEQAVTYFFDEDGDGYGSPLLTTATCTGPPVGYVTNSLDCNDSEPLAWTGAPEICFDGVDNNCDGSLYDGCEPVVVSMLPSFFDSVLPSVGSTITCSVPNVGSHSLAYLFTITNLTTNQTRVLPRTFRNFKLTMTDIFAYNTSFAIQVQAVVNGEVQPAHSPVCIVSTPTIPTSQLTENQCGATLSLITSTVGSTTVLSANLYRFRVAKSDTPTDYKYIERNFNNFNLNSVPGLNLRFRSGYQVAVQVRVLIDGENVWSDFGPTCEIFTPSLPDTGVSGCGDTPLQVASYFDAITVNAVAGATQYRYTLSGPGYSETITRSYRSFNLSMFPGLQPATEYSIAVEAEVYGVFYPGKDCSIVTPGGARPVSISEVQRQVVATETTVDVTPVDFNVVAYPNPYTSYFGLSLTSSSVEPVHIAVYDMTGRLIDSHRLEAAVLPEFTFGSTYPSGVFTAVISQGTELRTVRVVKR